MTVISVEKDLVALTMTITSEFAATVERVWQVWEDPRQLERWWGPPTYPATFVKHDLAPGSTVTYFMTGPEGDQHHGWWRIVEADPPHRLALVDGFADESGQANDELPTTTMEVSLTRVSDTRTVMLMTTTFASLEALEQLVAMGMEEGIKAALGQIDDLLLAPR